MSGNNSSNGQPWIITIVVAVISAVSGVVVALVNKPQPTLPSNSSTNSPVPSPSSTISIGIPSPGLDNSSVSLTPKSQENNKIGIMGNGNNNNQVVIADRSNVTVNDRYKSISETRIIPEDILAKLHPGVSFDYVKEVLGQPHIHRDDISVWNFNNASIQVNTDKDDNSVGAITLVTSSMDTFLVYPLNYKIGELKYLDVKDICEPLRHDYGGKFSSWRANCYFGNPGNYYNFSFGFFEGGKISYRGQELVGIDLNEGVFNSVSIARSGEDTAAIYWEFLR